MRFPFGKEEGVKGLGSQQKTSVLIIVILVTIEAPILIIDYLVQQQMLTQDMGMLFMFTSLLCEAAGIYGFNARAQIQAAQTLSFPASLWRFSPTEKTLIDLFVPKEGIRFIGKFTKKSMKTLTQDIIKRLEQGKLDKEEIKRLKEISKNAEDDQKSNPNPASKEEAVYVYIIPNVYGLGYTHPQKGELIYDRWVGILPDKFEETFEFTPGGETWWGSFPVTHPKSEGLVNHVVYWHDHMGETIPFCVVADSSHHYEQTLERCKLPNPDASQVVQAGMSILRKDNIELIDYSKNLEDHLEAKMKQSHDIEKLRRDELEDVKRWLGDVQRETPPLRYRLLNMKTLAIVIVVIAIAAIIWYSL